MDASHCPECRVERQPVAPPVPGHAWQLVVCPRCRALETTVHGLPSRLGYCPACHQRALVLLPSRDDARIVVVERCQVCGHADRVALTEERAEEREGRVIPFRR